GLAGVVDDVLERRVVGDDARVREDRDAVQVVPRLGLHDGELLGLDLFVQCGGDRVPGVGSRLVLPATVVAGAVHLVPEGRAGHGAGAGPREQRDLPVAGRQDVTQTRGAGVDDVEADLVAGGLDEGDLVDTTLVARAVSDTDFG